MAYFVRGWVALLALVLVGVLQAGEDPAPPELSDATYAALRDQIRPSTKEDQWREVGWRASFAQAVAEASATGRPIFLWAMNGHPLACT